MSQQREAIPIWDLVFVHVSNDKLWRAVGPEFVHAGVT
jgi:hypothetical protein